MMSMVFYVILNIVLLVLGILLGILFILWLLDREKAQGFQEKVDLTDRKQIEDMMGVFGHKPSQEQVNRFIASINKGKSKKKEQKTKRRTAKEE